MVFTMVPRVRAFRAGCGNSFDARSARRQLMPARETEAIILKTFPLGKADRLVSFLGRSSGRVRGVAEGGRRVKNRYGSTLDGPADPANRPGDRADRVLGAAAELLCVLDRAAGRMAAAIRSMLVVRNGVRSWCGISRGVGARAAVREVPASWNEICTSRGPAACGAIYGRTARPDGEREGPGCGAEGIARGGAGLDRAQ